MLAGIRKRLNYTNVLMTLALVFAMSGGAYAAGRYVITSTKQIKPSVLKQLQGKAGAPGATGAQGAKGETGPAGTVGSPGKEGSPGKGGENGASVTSKEFTGKKEKCGEGGSEFTSVSGKTYACNGSPWTAGGTLPSDKTETGAWSISVDKESKAVGAISFTIPLAKALGAPEVHYVNETGTEQVTFTGPPSYEFKLESTASCPGTAAEPAATPGNLCVYQRWAEGVETISGFTKAYIHRANDNPLEFTLGAATTGALIALKSEEVVSVFANGTWAVTAP